jgi:hypothetical protein
VLLLFFFNNKREEDEDKEEDEEAEKLMMMCLFVYSVYKRESCIVVRSRRKRNPQHLMFRV